MKKHIMSLIEAALLLTAAWMMGCDSAKKENGKVNTSPMQTTALAQQAGLATETAAAAAETTSDAENTEDTVMYTTYDAFLAALGEQYPGVAMFVPQQVLTEEWTLESVTLCTAEEPYYVYHMTNAEDHVLCLLVSVSKKYQSFDQLRNDVAAELADWDCTMLEDWCGSNWLIAESSLTNSRCLYGMTGDKNLYYCLSGTNADGSWIEPELLQTLHDTIRL